MRAEARMKNGMWMIGLLVACGGGGTPAVETAGSGGEADTGGGVVIEEDDDPRVSTSAGEEGGIVVLWPRVIGLPDQEPAQLQAHMVELTRRLFPDHRLDVRPDPERVCPRTGCLGTSVGALLVAQNGQCAVVAVVGRPRQGSLTLVRWAGDLEVRDRNIPFRDPPESHVTLRDRVDCASLGEALGENDGEVEAALRDVVPRMAL
ncbi:MAG: hypothetical protein K8H88_21500 [Sandaracinaceae bacterium]|nr:hypothetical protein [Sandaracinaceae bacterium]